MRQITSENARAILEEGELYRVGWNCTNKGEMFFVFDSFEILRGREWMNGWQGWTAGEAVDGVGYDRPAGPLAYLFEGRFCSGSGAEPVWILEDGESCEDIPHHKYSA